MKSQKQINKKQIKQIESVLNQTEIATKITILLPQTLSKNFVSINKPLITQYLLNKILNKKIKNGIKFIALYLGNQENFQIINVQGSQLQKKQENSQEMSNPSQKQKLYLVKELTKVEFELYPKQRSTFKQTFRSKSEYRFIKTQFLSSQLQNIKLAILSSLKNRQQFLNNGLGPLKGIIISGFSGTGKTTLVKNVLFQLMREYESQKQQLYTRTISSIHLLSKVVGGAEEYIRNTFIQIKEKQPAVLVVEDLHLLFSEKQIFSNRTAMAGLISELQAIDEEKVVVIGTANSDYELSAELKGSGRFQKQITLNLPGHHDRLQILQVLCSSITSRKSFCELECAIDNSIPIQELKSINLRMNGFSIGEIKQIIRESYTRNNNKISSKEIQKTLKNYKPSEIRQLIVEVPEVYWNDIGGYQNVKNQIKKVTELPLKYPEVFKKFGIEPIKGIMLYGPPGCSKTMMAKAIATQTKLNFIGVKGPELFSKYVGDSQKAIRNIFKRARACSPCIIFFDQIDAIAAQRSSNAQVSDRVLCQLLNQMDGIEGLKQVIIIAATNKPEILDPALTRPGRFDYMIYISPPDIEARKEIFKIYLSKSSNCQQLEQLAKALAQKTYGYTGAEISLVCRESVLLALQQNIECKHIEIKHYEAALKKIKKRLSNETITKYQNFQTNLKF